MARDAIQRLVRRWHTSLTSKRMRADFVGDGLAVKGRNLGFLDDPRFVRAWNFALEGNREGWRGKVPGFAGASMSASGRQGTHSGSKAISSSAGCIPG